MKKIFVCVLSLTIIFSFAACNSNDELLTWAKKLRTEDVTMIEAVAMPSLENQRYKYYDVSEFERIVEIINGAKGTRVDNPEGIAGGGFTFYVTTSDGERHTFANNGNIYLVINGHSYKVNHNWLSDLGNETLDSKVPSDFVY